MQLYDQFLDFVARDVQEERSRAHRRIFSAIAWCLLLPIATTFVIALFTRLGWFPRSAKGLADSTLLIFPVLYGIWVLGSEARRAHRAARNHGGRRGAFLALGPAREDARWRERVSAQLSATVGRRPSTLVWLSRQFQLDLERLRQRSRYLTALAGAVFFLIMQGIDWIEPDPAARPIFHGGPGSLSGLMTSTGEATGDPYFQFIGLAFFLLLLYLSGVQAHQSFSRYGECLDLLRLDAESRAAGDRPPAPL